MLYTFLWYALKLFIVAPFRVRFVGRQRVPASGPVLLAGNHESYLDPVLIALGLKRKVRFMAKSELWRNPVLAWIVDRLRAFPVQRGTADRNAIATASRILEEGGQVGIFPQGTRHHARGAEGLEEGAGGAALVALRTNSPVVPVGIYGSDRVRPEGSRFVRFPRITVVFGDPIRPDDIPGAARRERVQAMTGRIMEGIASAVAEAETLERGV